MPVAVPLLKFPDGEAVLCEEGAAVLRGLEAPVCVATFVGDARCGKSTLASALAGDVETFATGNGAAPVTSGIDVCAVPHPSGRGSLLLLDCEGGNNPSAPVRITVDVLAMLASTLTIQVAWGQMSEAQLQQIGQSLAIRDCMQRPDPTMSLPAQRLLIVVNACHLEYPPDYIAETIKQRQDGHGCEARNDLRSRIQEHYSEVELLTLPMAMKQDIVGRVESLRKAASESCAPVTMGGIELSGAQLVEVMASTVEVLRNRGEIPVPSIFRHVIYDHWLQPKVHGLTADFEASLPLLHDYEPDLHRHDTRALLLQRLDSETSSTSHKGLVHQARSELETQLRWLWDKVVLRNKILGEETREEIIQLEKKEEEVVIPIPKETSRRRMEPPCCFVGSRRPPSPEPEETVVSPPKYMARTRKVKKCGSVEYSPWVETGYTASDVPSGNCMLSTAVLSTSTTNMPDSDYLYSGLSAVPTP